MCIQLQLLSRIASFKVLLKSDGSQINDSLDL